MGFKQLRPLQNICVKTDYEEPHNPSQSTANDVFHPDDYIKHPKTSPIYAKTNSSSHYHHAQQQHRHSIITLLQPPSAAAGTVRKSVQQLGRERRNSENSLSLKPPSTAAAIRCQNSCFSSPSAVSSDTKPDSQPQTNQSGLIIQTGKLLMQSTGSQSPATMKKSRIPRKIRIPIFRQAAEKREDRQSGTALLGKIGNKCCKDRNKGPKIETTTNNRIARELDPLLGSHSSANANFVNLQHQYNMSTTPDKTKMLLISTPSITVTSEPILEEEPNNCSNDHDLNQILGNFIEATSPCPSRRGSAVTPDSVVTEFGIIDTSKCVDFGIYDFLSEGHIKAIQHSGDEVEVDNSSDTDASYLEASPPHRFSDSDFELLIEPLAITLETSLFSSSNIGIDKRRASRVNSQSNILFTMNAGTAQHSAIDESGKDKRFPHYRNDKKPLRRNISLPATMFKLRLIGIGKTISDFDNSTASSTSTVTAIVTPNRPRRTSAGESASARLARLESVSSTEAERLERGSLESLSTISMLWSTNSVHQSFTDDEYGDGDVSSNNSNSASAIGTPDFEDINGDNEYVFSEIEKRALTARNARQQLKRQDTLGNIAPPDFCNT